MMKKVFYNDAKLSKYIGEDYAQITPAEFIKRATCPKIPTPLLVSVRSGAA
jgi:hypothetical protein